MALSDRDLLARLIQCEAGGEGDNGMKAVAGVVMNRVHASGGEYARTGGGSSRRSRRGYAGVSSNGYRGRRRRR